MNKRTSIHGVGINDAAYPVYITKNKKINGKNVVLERWECHFYSTWRNMLQRCYSPKYHEKNQSYIGVTVCNEWHSFSAFKSWMDLQQWEGMHLDKDLLGDGIIYSPETCAFITPELNYFMRDELIGRYKYGTMAGAHIDRARKKWRSACSAGGKLKNLGRFDTELEAHLAWKAEKLKHAKLIAESISDERIRQALIARYM